MEAIAEFLNKAMKPILVGGLMIRVAKAGEALLELVDACGYSVAMMLSAKGLVSETHPRFIDIYWGVVSTFFCVEIIKSAPDLLFCVLSL